ncbi:hypothetical protein OEZ86_001587 [Tetradesmus obliquus]|nr:hypothetical protein OEZ86_001587 [Tetradesmus obliquus]
MEHLEIVRPLACSHSCFVSIVKVPDANSSTNQLAGSTAEPAGDAAAPTATASAAASSSGPSCQGVAKSYRKAKLDEDETRQVELEIKLHRQLSALSPHVVPFWAALDSRDSTTILTAHCKGDLRSTLEQAGGALSEAAVREQVAAPLLEVLVHMHRLGFVHRDIKPENLKQLQAGGTPAYTAPEVVQATFNNTPLEAAVGPQNDVWNLGVLVWEALAGRHPFGDHTTSPDTIHPRAHAAFNAFSDNGTFNPHLGAGKHRAVAAAAQAGAGSTCAPRFAQQQGPQPVTTLPVLKVPLGASPIDPSMPLELQLEVLTPQSGSACPVVIFTPGFLLNSSLYRSYAQRLASWGYTVLLWDLSDVLDDTLTVAYMKQVGALVAVVPVILPYALGYTVLLWYLSNVLFGTLTVAYMKQVIDMCGSDPRLRQYCNCSKLLLMGHSRGAKLSCLIAEQEPRVQGLCLIDPVDNSSFGPQGVGYPSSLPSLQAAASSRQLPVLIIGAALNTDVVPPEANWRRFVAAAAAGRAPVWEVVLKGSSHLQFLDKQQPLFALFSNNGPTPDEVVRQIVQTCMVAFAQLALCPSTPYNKAQVQTLLAEESEALKRLAPLDYSFQNMNQLRTAAPPPPPGAAAASNGGSSSSSTRACYSS